MLLLNVKNASMHAKYSKVMEEKGVAKYMIYLKRYACIWKKCLENTSEKPEIVKCMHANLNSLHEEAWDLIGDIQEY